MRAFRRIVVALLLGGLLLAAAPAYSQSPPRGDSDLTERYPLGDRTLAQPAPQPSREPVGTSRSETPFDTGSEPWPPLLVLVAVPFAVAAVGLVLRSLSLDAVTRTQPRRRRRVGPTTYRLARLLGFRYSAWRDALVLRGVGERFGPVLKLRARHAGRARPTR
ncbi:hypothetical protein VSS74_25195 [Conexibacter stalactiti]|uniref:DUF4129 domain-containing protein n=1 Tax=Conexibacter stalactiti TaxID=1940611 RepID=A0ABU4HWG9_9ACTN|nr:hypothetical protein [Conexibacter stalactiti]MDW5597672.1 hypothetical protein [Conexibacter stalactiti]MEC5038314.1 hypothetical protein [Conexibacter stalactiti]